MITHEIGLRPLSLEDVGRILNSIDSIHLSGDALNRIRTGRAFLDKKLKTASVAIYGINTGFGSLHNVSIGNDDLQRLQENLVKSHACGAGSVVSDSIVRAMILLKIIGLSKGNSGVATDTVQLLIELYNRDILPVVYELGSLGASGDLAPLAHLCLPLIGLGEVKYKGKVMASGEAFRAEGLSPLNLQAKEGLALLNGTQFMSAYGVCILLRARRLYTLANKIAALSLDAFNGRHEAFDEAIHALRPHNGQRLCAADIRNLLNGSTWINKPKDHVQDPYSFRCIPQVHGASLDAVNFAVSVFETEINAVTDNPTLLPEEDKIISAGNFHGQPLALALDFLCIALAELGSISERRTYKLVSGQRGLPPYLVANPGLNSGFMIAHYTAASIVSRNKQLCTPASVDSIDSSNGQEDHVSMGANAAVKAMSVIQNLERILAIELMCAAQAADFREGKTSPELETMRGAFRACVPFVGEDVEMHQLMRASESFISEQS